MTLEVSQIYFYQLKNIQGGSEDDKLDYILNPVFFYDTHISFFDGAAVGGFCGIDIYLKLSAFHSLRIYFAGGEGNNM
jgi:hypothetical protein